ncbi:MAG: imidazole glycerol phosphate synthase subunit HisH [Thermoanaerobaculia bacterium]
MKTTLVASPVANLANIERGLRAVGADLEITADPAALAAAERIVLPGVGSFPSAMQWLAGSGVANAILAAVSRDAKLLGVCVGHQLLFDSSEEMGDTRGLGLIGGRVRRLAGTLPVPQIGWNRIETNGDPLFEGIESGTPFYFVNSYVATELDPSSSIASGEYGERFVAAARRGQVCGVQFHPEKSSSAGLRVLRNFVWN